MKYTVKFRQKGRWFFRTLKNVKGDFLPPDMVGFRVFLLEDETRIEVPIEGTEFRFCPLRFISIKQKMEKEAGQSIVTS